MNLPNKLSILRICLVPFCLFFMLFDAIPFNNLIALAFFAIASFTDFLDGNIARKRGLVTNFGKFIDPLADKMLVCSVLICMISMGVAHPIAVVIIIFREFAVSGLRLVAAERKIVLAANIWGKVKTVMQIIVICGILFFVEVIPSEITTIACNWAVWLIAAVTVVSGVTYFWGNMDCLKEQ